MADIVFALRGNSTDARYSGGFPQGTKLNSAYVTTVADAGCLSGSYVDLTDTARVKSLIFNGRKNTPNSRSHSILLRFSPSYSGAPAARRMLWCLSVGLGASSAYLEIFHEVTSGNVFVIGKNEAGSVTASTVNLGAWTTGVSGTLYDFLFVWDGTTTANGLKLYIDNVLLGSGGTATNALLSSWDNTYWKSIALGCGINGTVCAMKVDEFVVWDGAVNPASVALVSGTGSLNGASRTSLVNASSFDGSLNSDPGVANVRSGTAYTSAGLAKTGTASIPVSSNVRSGIATDATAGTLVVPSASEVKIGVSFDTSSTGTYDGSDRWTDPGEDNVRLGIAYKANSTTSNKAGSVVIPSLANTKIGVSGDGGSGIYDGSDRWSDPGEINVLVGVSYKANSTTNNKTGTYSPTVSTDPGVANVRSGTAYTIEDVSLVGTLSVGAESIDPGIENVKVGVEYMIDDISLTGTLEFAINNTGNATLVGQSPIGELEITNG